MSLITHCPKTQCLKRTICTKISLKIQSKTTSSKWWNFTAIKLSLISNNKMIGTLNNKLNDKIQKFKNMKTITQRKNSINPCVKLATLKSLRNLDFSQTHNTKRRQKIVNSGSPTQGYNLMQTLQSAMKNKPKQQFNMALNSLWTWKNKVVGNIVSSGLILSLIFLNFRWNKESIKDNSTNNPKTFKKQNKKGTHHSYHIQLLKNSYL